MTRHRRAPRPPGRAVHSGSQGRNRPALLPALLGACIASAAWANPEETACPRPPVNPAVAETIAKTSGGEVKVGGFGVGGKGGVENTTTYAGTGLSQQAADDAWKLYQLCIQAEKGLIPQDLYVQALKTFYGFSDPKPSAAPARGGQPAPTSARVNLGTAEGAEPPAADPVVIRVDATEDPDPQRVVVVHTEPVEGLATTAPPREEPARAAVEMPEQALEPVPEAATPTCVPIRQAEQVRARMSGTIGVSESLAWQRSARVGWLWSNHALGLGSQMVRIYPDGRMDTPGALNIGAAVQQLSTLDPKSFIWRTVEGTAWGGYLLDVEGWRLIGDEGLVGAQKDGAMIDLAAWLEEPVPYRLYQLPIVSDDDTEMLALSMDPGATRKDTLIRTWWVDGGCLNELAIGALD